MGKVTIAPRPHGYANSVNRITVGLLKDWAQCLEGLCVVYTNISAVYIWLYWQLQQHNYVQKPQSNTDKCAWQLKACH